MGGKETHTAQSRMDWTKSGFRRPRHWKCTTSPTTDGSGGSYTATYGSARSLTRSLGARVSLTPTIPTTVKSA